MLLKENAKLSITFFRIETNIKNSPSKKKKKGISYRLQPRRNESCQFHVWYACRLISCGKTISGISIKNIQIETHLSAACTLSQISRSSSCRFSSPRRSRFPPFSRILKNFTFDKQKIYYILASDKINEGQKSTKSSSNVTWRIHWQSEIFLTLF